MMMVLLYQLTQQLVVIMIHFNQQAKQPILRQQFSNSSAALVNRYVPVKISDRPSSSAQESMSLPTNCSFEKLTYEPVYVREP